MVFTNREVEVKNRDRTLKTTFLGPLPYIISEYDGVSVLSEKDLDQIAAVIEEERCKETYAMEIDMSQYKRDFAAVIFQLEEAQAVAERKEVRTRMSFMEIIRRIFTPEKVQAAA